MDIDDLLKKSFEQPSFAYKDDYWQAASAKLDQHFKRKFYIQISTIALILILAVLLSYLFYSDSSPKLNRIKNNNSSIETGIALKENDQNKVSINSNEESLDPNVSKFSHLDKMSNDQAKFTDLSPTNALKQNSITSSNKFKKKSDQINLTDSKNSNQSLKSKDSRILNENLIADPIELETQTIQSEPMLVDNEGEELQVEESKSKDTEFNPLMTLACLALPFNLLMEEDLFKFERVNLENQLADLTPIANKSYLEYGLMVEISTFPKFSGDNKNIVGGNGGVELRYHFNNNFLLRSGINFGYRSGSFSPSVYSTQKSFLLGPQEDAFVFRPTGLVSITLPLQLAYRFDKFMIGFGINNHFLAATYGNLEYAESDFRNNANNKPFEEYTLIEKGWLSNAGLRRFVNSYQISVNRTIYNRLSAGINVQYFPKDWTTDSYGQVYSFEAGQYINPTFDNIGLIEKNWIVNFNIYYRL